jgi:hypothetical protein
MKRGSLRRRLPRGRRSLKASPALLGLAAFLVLLVPTFFYLFPGAPNSHSALPSATDFATSVAAKAEFADTPEPILKVTSSDASLMATVNISQGLSQVYLENTGTAQLHHVEVSDRGNALGVLSRLVPGEKKVLAMNGPRQEIKVKALDPSDREIWGKVQYNQPIAPDSLSGPASENTVLSTKAAPEMSGTPAQGASDLQDPASESNDASPLRLAISANKSEGREGDVVGYRCTAENSGQDELSDVKIFCRGKMASTKFLPSGEELYLDGSLVIRGNTQLMAGVQGRDAQDRIFTKNTSNSIWKIAPEIKLEVSAPNQVHRGETVTLQVSIKNSGSGNLTDIKISDGFGEIGQISALPSGAFQVLQKERTVQESVSDEVRVIARDAAGRDVFSSQSLDFRVLNSSLQIQGQPEEVRAYPGEPTEVTWILSNTGEEVLKNITLSGDGKRCMLRELSPGKSVKMAAIYSKGSAGWINVTVQGYDGRGYAVAAEGSVLLKTIEPGISLKVMPQELVGCPGETGEISCLVTNSGDDVLTDVVLSQDGSALASIDRLDPGEFKVVASRTVISANSTLQFAVTGKDSRSRTWSDAASVNAKVVVTALKVFVSASPPTVAPGNSTKLTCTVANTGSIPLYSIFVISKKLGPLGNIDYLAPKRQMMVTAEKAILEEVDDVISAEGFTQEKKPVRGICSLHIGLLKYPGLEMKGTILDGSYRSRASGTPMEAANLGCGNLSMPLSLPSEEETSSRASREVAEEVDRSTATSNNMLLDGISNLLRYVEKILGRTGQESGSSAAREFSPEDEMGLSASRDYELSIEGVKSSEHGAIRILDVSASPSQPAAGEPIKVTVHIQSQAGIKSASVKYGLADTPLTKQDMLGVDRVYDSPLALESGNSEDGYWSCTIPGKAAGIYLVLSAWMTDGSITAEGGPYMLHWSTVNTAGQGSSARKIAFPSSGMLFIESSVVKGRGEVSIKDTFQGSALHYKEKMIGNGSISLESMRCIDRKTAVENFTEQKDLVFTGGQLKGRQTVESPTFHGGLGASVTERFNLSHVDKSETSSVSSASFANNTLAFKTDQAFDGTWDIQTKYAKFFKKIKADQQYTGSFQTQKSIKFQDAEQK